MRTDVVQQKQRPEKQGASKGEIVPYEALGAGVVEKRAGAGHRAKAGLRHNGRPPPQRAKSLGMRGNNARARGGIQGKKNG